MDFGNVLSRAWRIIWDNKVLWIFGILAGCGSTSGSSGNFQSSFRTDAPPQMQRFFNGFANLPDWQIALIVGAVILVILVLVVIAIFLGTIGRIGLIRGTYQADQQELRPVFGELFSGSMPYFWRVFGLNLLVGLAYILFIVVLLVPLFIVLTVITFGIALLCLIPLLCLLVPISWLVNVIVEQANIAIVVENVGILEGLQRGWEVFRNNFGSMIMMALILYLGVNLIVGFIIGLPLALVAAPLVVEVVRTGDITFGSGFYLSAICFVVYLPVLLVLGGALRAYIESSWTLTYLRLTGRMAPGAPMGLDPVEPEPVEPEPVEPEPIEA